MKSKMQTVFHLPPRILIIKSKDLSLIKNIDRKYFTLIDDSVGYNPEEFSGNLSEKERENYLGNKKKLKKILVTAPSEETTYPAVALLRKVLSYAQTIGALIILILSL